MEHLKKRRHYCKWVRSASVHTAALLCGGQRATCGAGPFLCPYIGSGDRTRAFGFVCQVFCPLSHLTSSRTRLFFSFLPQVILPFLIIL